MPLPPNGQCCCPKAGPPIRWYHRSSCRGPRQQEELDVGRTGRGIGVAGGDYRNDALCGSAAASFFPSPFHQFSADVGRCIQGLVPVIASSLHQSSSVFCPHLISPYCMSTLLSCWLLQIHRGMFGMENRGSARKICNLPAPSFSE